MFIINFVGNELIAMLMALQALPRSGVTYLSYRSSAIKANTCCYYGSMCNVFNLALDVLRTSTSAQSLRRRTFVSAWWSRFMKPNCLVSKVSAKTCWRSQTFSAKLQRAFQRTCCRAVATTPLWTHCDVSTKVSSWQKHSSVKCLHDTASPKLTPCWVKNLTPTFTRRYFNSLRWKGHQQAPSPLLAKLATSFMRELLGRQLLECLGTPTDWWCCATMF